MTDRQTFTLISPRVRANALEAVRLAPDRAKVIVQGPQRSVPQNSKFHAMCRDIANAGIAWAGKVRDEDAWKQLIISGHSKATRHEAEVVEGLEGELVSIRESTSKMDKARASSLIEYTLAWGTERGVRFSDTEGDGR